MEEFTSPLGSENRELDKLRDWLLPMIAIGQNDDQEPTYLNPSKGSEEA